MSFVKSSVRRQRTWELRYHQNDVGRKACWWEHYVHVLEGRGREGRMENEAWIMQRLVLDSGRLFGCLILQWELQKNIYFCFIDYAKTFDCVGHNKLWTILTEMGIPDHLTCLLRNLYAGQEATVRTGHGTTDWFQIGKAVQQGYILLLCLFNLYAEHIVRMLR